MSNTEQVIMDPILNSPTAIDLMIWPGSSIFENPTPDTEDFSNELRIPGTGDWIGEQGAAYDRFQTHLQTGNMPAAVRASQEVFSDDLVMNGFRNILGPEAAQRFFQR